MLRSLLAAALGRGEGFCDGVDEPDEDEEFEPATPDDQGEEEED